MLVYGWGWVSSTPVCWFQVWLSCVKWVSTFPYILRVPVVWSEWPAIRPDVVGIGYASFVLFLCELRLKRLVCLSDMSEMFFTSCSEHTLRFANIVFYNENTLCVSSGCRTASAGVLSSLALMTATSPAVLVRWCFFWWILKTVLAGWSEWVRVGKGIHGWWGET